MNLIYLWEKAMYYSSVAYGEYAKIGQFVRDALLIVTALAVRGYKPRKWQIVGCFVGIVLLSVILGIILVKLKVPQYNNTLGNAQNPQIQQILTTQQQILNKLK
jgi:predicted PurR-regulated permease PerM